MRPLNLLKRASPRWLVGLYVVCALVIMVLIYRTAHAAYQPPALQNGPADKSGVVQQSQIPSDTTAPPPSSLNEQAKILAADTKELAREKEFLEERAKAVDTRADDLSHLISTLTAVSGFYTVLVGVFAYFSLENAKKNAETQLAQYKEQLEETKASIPNLYGMQRALRELLFRLRRQVATSEIWTSREAYDAMSETRRQEVLLAEMTMTSFDYFGPDKSPEQSRLVSDIFANLCGFYASRSKTADPFIEGDFARAYLYIDRACQMNPENAGHFAARAALTIVDVKRPGDKVTANQLDRAAADLKKCLDLDPKDPEGLYNAAWIDDERGDRQRAEERLTELIDLGKDLPKEFHGRRLISTLINRACARAHLVQNPPRGPFNAETTLQGVLADCRAAKKEAVLYREEKKCVESLEREWSADGELFPLIGRITTDELLEMQKLYEDQPSV